LGGKKKDQATNQGRDVRSSEPQHDELGALTPEEKLVVLQERQRRLDVELRALQKNEARPSRN